MNVKHPNKGTRLKDVYMQPLTLSPGNGSIEFLENMLVWLELWKESSLETDTHLALTHTTHAIPELAKYCMTIEFQLFSSSKYGLIEIKSFDISAACEEKSTMKLSEIIHSIAVGENYLRDLYPVISVFTYLAGYCVYKLLKKLKCNECHSGLVSDKYLDSSHSLIKELDRGSLQYPPPDVVSILMCAYAVMPTHLNAI
ncbi:hypothetical protein PR048_008890 [Dryococelus australis]|uniref:Uncharacterized protein n=1 Tax=Dryococelus australis TaxID=614101 RepID=A0ABQ9HYD9_9NEOP|nr:hypothetical protein PR048_008890 [Dryococelus australis]